MGRINQLAEKTTLNSTDVIAVDAGAGGNTNKMTGANLAGQLKALGDYQDKLTFDTTPTAGSTNPVTSGGVKTALDGKQNTLTFDTTPTAGSTNPVTSGGIATAIQQSTAWRRLYANGTYTNHVGVTLQLSESLQNVKLLFITAYTSSISSANRIVFIIPVNSSIGASYFCAAYGTTVQTIRVEGSNTSFTVLSTSLQSGLFINEIVALG